MANFVSPPSKRRHTGMHCMAPGCCNYHGKDKSKHYHRLPLGKEDLLQQWLSRMKLARPPVLDYARVCSDHFTPEDYLCQGQFEKDGSFRMKKTSTLNPTAVPSLFDFSGYSRGATDAPSVCSPTISTRSQRISRRSQEKANKDVIYKALNTDSVGHTDVPLHQPMTVDMADDDETCSEDTSEGTGQESAAAVGPVAVKTATVATQTDEDCGTPCQCQQRKQMLQTTKHDHSYSSSTTPKHRHTPDELTSPAQKEVETPARKHLPLPAILPRPTTCTNNSSDDDSSSVSTISSQDGCDKDSDYAQPLSPAPSSSSACSDVFEVFQESMNALTDDKFLVHKSQLLELFTTCNQPECGKPLSEEPIIRCQGSAVSVTVTCIDGHTIPWYSQPFVKNIPACNLLLPAAIFLTGNSYSTMAEVFKAINLHTISPRQCYNLQKIYVIPEVEDMWVMHNEAVLATVADKPVIVSGDARCDSPGHNATFGTYSLLDDASHLILAQETVKVTEVKNSYWLEPEGMTRSLDNLNDHDVKVSHLATDRHPTIQKMMREQYDDIQHEYDLWHIQKGVKKKVVASKDHDLLLWLQAIINHLWYCVAHCHGNAALLKEMWISILHHITDEHYWRTGELFHRCEHAPYTREERKSRPWLKKSSKSFKLLQSIVLDKRLLKNLEKVTCGIHTGELESVHALYTKYVPKRKKYSQEGFTARLHLAAIDHNTSVERQQATTKAGQPRFKMQYSKGARAYVAKPVKVEKEHEYRQELLTGVLNRCENSAALRQQMQAKPSIKEKTIGEHRGLEKPDKMAVIAKHVSRFSKKD